MRIQDLDTGEWSEWPDHLIRPMRTTNAPGGVPIPNPVPAIYQQDMTKVFYPPIYEYPARAPQPAPRQRAHPGWILLAILIILAGVVALSTALHFAVTGSLS